MNYILLSIAIIFILGITFTPKFGAIALYKKMRADQERELMEDALKYLIDKQYENEPATRDSLGGALRLSQAKASQLTTLMESQGLINTKGSRVELTAEGEQWAIQMVRAHRLWEKYLAVEAKMPLDKVHKEAHRLEHHSSAAQIDQIEVALGFPKYDPHGDPIPDQRGQITENDKTSITNWPTEKIAVVVEIEDEPIISYQQIGASGIKLGMTVRVLEHDNHRLILSDGQNEITLAPVVASNIMVATPLQDAPTDELRPLNSLKNGERAEVAQFDETVQGLTRRRFLDLGLTPGALIYPELENFFREPRAYRVRGTLIALRDDQANRIKVKNIVAEKSS